MAFWLCVSFCFIICLWFFRTPRKRDLQIHQLPGFKISPAFTSLYVIKLLMESKSTPTNVLLFGTLYKLCSMFYSYGIFRFYIGWHPIVACFSPAAVEPILNSTVNVKKDFPYTFITPWIKEGLLTSNPPKWKNRRKMLTCAFHFRILQDFYPLLNERANCLVEVLREIGKEKSVDITFYMTRCALDVIYETALGIRLDSLRNRDCKYLQEVTRVGDIFLSRLVRPWLWHDRIFYLTSTGKRFLKSVEILNNFAKDAIRKRKEELQHNEKVVKPTKKIFLDLLLEQQKDERITDEEILEEVNAFVFAGHDTTAYAMCWVLYLLGMHLDIQLKLVEEIDSIFGDDKERMVDAEDLRQLKYLECIIKESQRLFPSVPLISRCLNEDVNINGYTIPKDTTCILHIYMLHRNPYIYFQPKRFDPDRFLPENSKGRHPFAFVPFSAGPRNCIGQRLATMEEKIILCNIFRNYTVESLDKNFCDLYLTGEMILRPKFGLRVKFYERK